MKNVRSKKCLRKFHCNKNTVKRLDDYGQNNFLKIKKPRD